MYFTLPEQVHLALCFLHLCAGAHAAEGYYFIDALVTKGGAPQQTPSVLVRIRSIESLYGSVSQQHQSMANILSSKFRIRNAIMSRTRGLCPPPKTKSPPPPYTHPGSFGNFNFGLFLQLFRFYVFVAVRWRQVSLFARCTGLLASNCPRGTANRVRTCHLLPPF